MYDRTVPVFTHGLKAMSAILTKAEAHCAERKIDPSVLLTDRLYPDMLPFTRQVQIATDHARRCPARLAGVEPVSMADTEATFPELRDRIARSVEHIATFTPASFEGAAERTITFKAGPRDMTFTGSDYVGFFALPNFYFHLTAAYAILRHDGVPLGKTDFMGG
ncbi:MAG: DUF1993 family protein [Paracoccaceae bacterium]